MSPIFEAPDFEEKISLYQNAKALVIPLDKDYVEALGLVYIEAMANRNARYYSRPCFNSSLFLSA